VEQHEQDAIQPIHDLNDKIMQEAQKLTASATFTTDANLTQTLVPMQPTAQQAAPLRVEATLDPYLISSAIADTFAANERDQSQAAVALSKESITTLASAIVDSIRAQSRQGVTVLG
jgi:hypothetical protein